MSDIRRVIQIKGPFSELANNEFGYTIQDVNSSDSLIDADIVFIDLHNIEVPIEAYYDPNYENQINGEYKTKRQQIEAHLKSGKSVIAFVTGQAEIYSIDEDEGGSTYMRVNEESLLPKGHQLIKIRNSGINVEPCNEIVASELEKLEKPRLFNYEYILRQNQIDVPLLKIRNSNEIVAGIKYFDKGRIYYLPRINEGLIKSDRLDQMLLADLILLFTSNLSRLIKKNVSDTVPEWVDEMRILEEVSIRDSIRELEAKISRLASEKKDYEEKLETLTKFKSILSSSGDQLENAVEAVFSYLGLSITRGTEKNRVDFIISHDEKYIVCEVKGAGGTAKESFAAQLEKWSSEFYSHRKIIPKGLLIVATHNRIPPVKRDNNIHFPEQMMRYVKMKNQACMTTITLLEILKKYTTDEWSSDYVFNLLYDQIGVIEV